MFDNFGGLDEILDDDIGYVPSMMKRDSKPKIKALSRQNSTQSIGQIAPNKDEDFKSILGNNKSGNNDYLGLNKLSPKNSDFGLEKETVREQPRKNSTLFGAHKQTAVVAQNNTTGVTGQRSFLDFFKNQNGPANSSNSARPPLPDSKPPLPQKKNLFDPESILDDDINNSSMASRRGRPPMSRRNQASNENQIQQNRSENFAISNTPILPPVPVSIPVQAPKQQQPIQITQNTQNTFSTVNNSLITDSIEELKKVFSSQLQYQKQGFETMIKQERESHQLQTKNLKELHSEQMKKKLEIKDFELQKVKEFYELQLKIYNERQTQIKEYNLITKKLQGNIETIEKMEKNFKDTEFKNKKEKDQQIKKSIQKRQRQLNQKQSDVKELMTQYQKQKQQFRSQKLTFAQSIESQKSRLYDLEVELRKRQAELQNRYKKLEVRLNQEYQNKTKQIQKQRQLLRTEQLNLTEQRNIIEVQKLELINSRKLWDNEKKVHLEQLHQQKTKVLEKQIQIASRTGQIEIKEQQVQMHQNDYINKLKLIDLQKKKLQIEKNNSKGQLYVTASSGAFKTHGLLGTSLLSKTNHNISLQRQFYSNGDNEPQSLNEQSNYKKSITQMRDEFLKSMPKF